MIASTHRPGVSTISTCIGSTVGPDAKYLATNEVQAKEPWVEGSLGSMAKGWRDLGCGLGQGIQDFRIGGLGFQGSG